MIRKAKDEVLGEMIWITYTKRGLAKREEIFPLCQSTRAVGLNARLVRGEHRSESGWLFSAMKPDLQDNNANDRGAR